jgi:hypothetical protein
LEPSAAQRSSLAQGRRFRIEEAHGSAAMPEDQARQIADAFGLLPAKPHEMEQTASRKQAVQDLKFDVEKALHRQTWGLVGVIFAQGAFIVAVLQLLA